MQIHPRFLAAALAALPLAGCGADRSLGPDDSMFVATIQGSVQDSYRGTGQFDAQTLSGADLRLFTISSRDLASGQTFFLFREGAELPQPGSYPLAGYAAGPARFGAVYTRRQGEAVEGFTATSGELRIVSASAERIEGTFHFQGTRNCAGTATSLQCSQPPDPAGPAVEITGSFVAVEQKTLPPPLPSALF
ncbi:MAG: hypothetical protein ACJ8GN_09755 [Longimicrobiaceae bacterium]